MHNHRQWEIAGWLRQAEDEGVEVSGWCAIDDEELVSCSPEDGGGKHNLRYASIFQGRCVKTASRYEQEGGREGGRERGKEGGGG